MLTGFMKLWTPVSNKAIYKVIYGVIRLSSVFHLTWWFLKNQLGFKWTPCALTDWKMYFEVIVNDEFSPFVASFGKVLGVVEFNKAN